MVDASGSGFRERFQFSLKAAFVAVVFAAVFLGWWRDRASLRRELETTRSKLDQSNEAAGFGKRKLLEELRAPGVVGSPIDRFPQVQAFADRTFDGTAASWLWEGVSDLRDGKKCIGYEFQMGETKEFETNVFYVLTADGRIVTVREIEALD